MKTSGKRLENYCSDCSLCILAAAEPYEMVLVLRVEAVLVFEAGTRVVGIPRPSGDKVIIFVPFARRRGPFPHITVHIVHAVPAAALFLAPGALRGFRVGVAFGLVIGAAVGVAESVLAAAGRLPFDDGAEALAALFAKAFRLFVRYHVLGLRIGGVRIFVGVDAYGAAADGYGVGVLAAYVISRHVVMGALPGTVIPCGILCAEEYVTGLVVCHGFGCRLRMKCVTDGKESRAMDFVTFDLERNGVVVAAGRGNDRSLGRNGVRLFRRFRRKRRG